MATNRACKNNPDVFCYICGKFIKVSNRKKIDELVDSFYHACFGKKLGDQDKSWAHHHIVCKTCFKHLHQRKNGKCNSLKFWCAYDLDRRIIRMIVTSVHLI